MDEVDGMAGNEDRGGVAELINLIKASKVPVIAMCNDRNHQKIRSLSNYCFDLRFSRPRVEQIKAAMMSVCFKEKIPIKPDALSELISGCGQDVRQVLHHLSMIKASGVDGAPKMEADQARKEAEMSKERKGWTRRSEGALMVEDPVEEERFIMWKGIFKERENAKVKNTPLQIKLKPKPVLNVDESIIGNIKQNIPLNG